MAEYQAYSNTLFPNLRKYMKTEIKRSKLFSCIVDGGKSCVKAESNIVNVFHGLTKCLLNFMLMMSAKQISSNHCLSSIFM